ncbi:MAG TPA: MBL fold metallo-hydrolase [Arenimonas sp.]|nr:MBL fold metallo-hydrolase [Arenimonas sp.]
MLLVFATQAGAQPATGSLGVRWNPGAADCEATPQPPLQVHAYEPHTFILRQSPCAHFEANFLYLLVGSERALLIDTGAIADPAQMPLASTVLGLLPEGETRLPLVVAHSHGHSDHDAGDAQFTGLPSVEIVPSDLEGMTSYFGFDHWPEGVVRLDLGGRVVHVIPAPGHHRSHVLFYDERTGLLFTGDYLLNGRLLVDDAAVYHASAERVARYFETLPVTHILGGHIERDAQDQLYPSGSRHHPDEGRLELPKSDLSAMPAALAAFNGFYTQHGRLVVVHPLRMLMVFALGGLVALSLVGWGLLRWMRRRRRASA